MNAKKLLPACLLGLLAGCVPVVSLHPLFTSETIVFEDKLLGAWSESADDPEPTFEFTRLDAASLEDLREKLPADPNRFYRLVMTGTEGRKGIFVAGLVKLEGQLYLDVFTDHFPSGKREPEDMKLLYNAFFFVPAHMFAKVDLTDEELTIRLTEAGEFEGLIEEQPGAIAHQVVDDRPVLTAPTAELQRFVAERRDDGRLFPTEINLVRRGKP